MVGATRIELATSRPPGVRATTALSPDHFSIVTNNCHFGKSEAPDFRRGLIGFKCVCTFSCASYVPNVASVLIMESAMMVFLFVAVDTARSTLLMPIWSKLITANATSGAALDLVFCVIVFSPTKRATPPGSLFFLTLSALPPR